MDTETLLYIDKLVATGAMGWKLTDVGTCMESWADKDGKNTYILSDSFNPASDINDTLKVLSKFENYSIEKYKDEFSVYINSGKCAKDAYMQDIELIYYASNPSLNLAVCLAILESIGIDTNDLLGGIDNIVH